MPTWMSPTSSWARSKPIGSAAPEAVVDQHEAVLGRADQQVVGTGIPVTGGERQGGELLDVLVGPVGGLQQPRPQGVVEGAGDQGVVPDPLVPEHRQHLDPQPAVDVVPDVEGMAADVGALRHPGADGQPPEQVSGVRVARAVPGRRHHLHLLEPDGRGLLVEVDDREGAGHREPVRQPVSQVGAVGEGLGAPRHRRLGLVAVVGGDVGEVRRAGPGLHVLDEHPERLGAATGVDVAGDPVATGGGDGRAGRRGTPRRRSPAAGSGTGRGRGCRRRSGPARRR